METKQTDVKQTEEKKMEPKQTKKKGANPFRSNKFKRGGMAHPDDRGVYRHCGGSERGGFRPDPAVPLYGY